MPINCVEPPNGKQPASGCLIALLCLMTILVSILQLFFVQGFWLGCGMFLTIMVGGVGGGVTGLKIGAFIGRFACPSGIFTSEGLLGIVRLKLFWMFGPQLIGIILGWALGVHLLLMLFWGMPITYLGQAKVSFRGHSSSIPISQRVDILKKNVDFLGKMGDADFETKQNMLLMVAIDSDSIVTVKKLLANHVDVNTPRIPLTEAGTPYTENGEKLTPLWAAITYAFDRDEIAMMLIKHGADVNARNDKFKGPTPLLYVLRNDKLNLVNPLIYAGAKLDVIDVDGKTPLHHAANKNMPQAVQLLLERGAKFDVKDRFGHTPLDYAEGQIKTIIHQHMKD